MVGPWVFRLASDLGNERADRVRTQERADVAAHLHDSVLQTLALIQNAADAAGGPPGPRPGARPAQPGCLRRDRAAGTSRRALRAAAEVEDEHGVAGRGGHRRRRAVDETGSPLVLAAREAMVNAAKHAGAEQVDVFAEVRRRQVEVFVRDRGAGFDRGRCPRTARGPRQHRRPHGPSRRYAVIRRHPATAPRWCCACRGSPGGGERIMTRLSSSSMTTRCSAPGCAPSWGDAVDVVGEAADVDSAVAAIAELRPTWCCSTCTCPMAAGRR